MNIVLCDWCGPGMDESIYCAGLISENRRVEEKVSADRQEKEYIVSSSSLFVILFVIHVLILVVAVRESEINVEKTISSHSLTKHRFSAATFYKIYISMNIYSDH